MRQGLSDWRLYSAEQSVGENPRMSIAQMRDFVADAASSEWWIQAFPDTAPIEVMEGGHDGDGFIMSFASQVGRHTPERYVISMHPQMLTMRVLIHELAHCAAPSVWGDPKRIRAGTLEFGEYPHHGPMFVATLALLTEQLLPSVSGSLREAFMHFEVPMATPEELRRAVSHEPAVRAAREHYEDETRAELDTFNAQYEQAHGEQPPVGVVPEWHWGEWLWLMRRPRAGVRRRTSQRAVAEAVSNVFPCTARQIATIERRKDYPEDPDQLKRAMLAAISLNADPIWLRYVVGLTRWDCGDVTLDEARAVNTEWAELVEKMNCQIEDRPSRWCEDGSR